MTPLNIFLITSTICTIILTWAVASFLNKLQKSLAKVDETMDKVNNDLDPLLLATTETVEELQILTASLNDKLDRTDSIINHAEEAITVIASTTYILKDKVAPILIQIASLNAGLKGFTRFFTR